MIVNCMQTKFQYIFFSFFFISQTLCFQSMRYIFGEYFYKMKRIFILFRKFITYLRPTGVFAKKKKMECDSLLCKIFLHKTNRYMHRPHGKWLNFLFYLRSQE